MEFVIFRTSCGCAEIREIRISQIDARWKNKWTIAERIQSRLLSLSESIFERWRRRRRALKYTGPRNETGSQFPDRLGKRARSTSNYDLSNQLTCQTGRRPKSNREEDGGVGRGRESSQLNIHTRDNGLFVREIMELQILIKFRLHYRDWEPVMESISLFDIGEETFPLPLLNLSSD